MRPAQGTGRRSALLCGGFPVQDFRGKVRDGRASWVTPSARHRSRGLAVGARWWGAFGGEACCEEAGAPDLDWSGSLASDPAVQEACQEVQVALKLVDVRVYFST